MKTERIRLEGISPRTWEHPADRAALTVLTQVPGLSDLMKLLGGLFSDRQLKLYWMSSAVRSGPLQIPAAYQAVAEACRVLDVSPIPEVFVSPGLDHNAGAIGFESPFVVLGGGLVQSLSPEELLAVAGHEIAHIKAGHSVYRTAIWLLAQVSMNQLGVGALIQATVTGALMDWSRKSELSCDRAGLLACQDPQAALGALIKVCYPGLADRVDAAELLRQGSEWEASGDLLDSLYKVIGVWNQTHPSLVPRYSALHEWSQGSEYPAILSGAKRSPDTSDPAAEMRQAWDSWKAELNRSQDPGTKMVADGLKQAESFLKDFLGR